MLLFARQDVNAVRIVGKWICLVRKYAGHIRVTVEEIDLNRETEGTAGNPV